MVSASAIEHLTEPDSPGRRAVRRWHSLGRVRQTRYHPAPAGDAGSTGADEFRRRPGAVRWDGHLGGRPSTLASVMRLRRSIAGGATVGRRSSSMGCATSEPIWPFQQAIKTEQHVSGRPHIIRVPQC